MTYLILYKDKTAPEKGLQVQETADSKAFMDIINNPDYHIQYIFDKNADANENLKESMRNFRLYAEKYGLSPDALGQKVKTANHEYLIAGLKPSNTKYKICLLDTESLGAYKSSVEAVRKVLDPKYLR